MKTYHLNYPRKINDVLGRKSRAVNGRTLQCVEQTYDPNADKTRLTFVEVEDEQ